VTLLSAMVLLMYVITVLASILFSVQKFVKPKSVF